jgi:protease I
MARVLIATGDAGESFEVLYMYYRLKEAGHEPHIGAPTKKALRLVIHDFEPDQETYIERPGYRFEADIAFADANPDDYDGLVITGGRAPEYIRLNTALREIVRDFFAKEKPVGAICHAAQVLIAAGVVRDRQVAAYEAMEPDVTAAGGSFQDQALVEDGHLVSSRVWPDIWAFSRGFLEQLDRYGVAAGSNARSLGA